MSDLHMHKHAHSHISSPQAPVVPEAPVKPSHITKPPPSGDTISSAGGGTLNIAIKMYSGSPVLQVPHLQGMDSASLMLVVLGALDKFHQRQRESSLRFSPFQVEQMNTDTVTTTTTTLTAKLDKDGKPVLDKDGNPVLKPVTTTSSDTVLTLQNHTLGRIADTLADDLFHEIKKHNKSKKKETINQLQAFVQQALVSGVLLSIPPTLDLLRTGGHPPTFVSGKAAIAAATAVSYTDLVSQSGAIFDDFAKKQFPHKPHEAARLSTSMQVDLLGLGLNEISGALGLPGLPKQVVAQAALVREEGSVLQHDSFRKRELTNILNIVYTAMPGVNRGVVQNKIEQALVNLASQGEFNTRQEIVTALKKAFQTIFPENVPMADQLAQKVEKDALDQALASGGNLYSPNFDLLKINVAMISDSILTSILNQFSKSDAEIRAQTVAADIADGIKQGIIKGQLKSEQNIRDFIQSQLKDQEIDAHVAHRIAYEVNLGLPVAEPLMGTNSIGMLSPDAFHTEIHNVIGSRLHVAPDTPLGTKVVHMFEGMISLINKSYHIDQTKGENALLLSPTRQGIIQEYNFLDPAKHLINEWTLMGRTSNDAKSELVTKQMI